MKRVRVRAPLRADLAGGTLDLWPLYLFHPGARTVNVAISYHAESEVGLTTDPGIEIFLTDLNYRKRYETLAEASADPKVVLIAKALEHFGLTGVSVTTRTDAPRGSGLGGSSALTVTLVRALSEVANAPVEGDELITLVRDLESRLLQSPAGVQDYYPPVYGGLASLHLNPGKITRVPIALPVEELAEHFVLHYSEVSHFSGTNNWEIYKRHIDGDEAVREGLGRLATTSRKMEDALTAGDLAKAGAALGEEWENRKALIAGVSTPEIDEAIAAAAKAGAWGGKVCGAGGGGCIVFLMPPRKRKAVLKALSKVPGRVVEANPVSHGLTIDLLGSEQAAFGFAGRRFRPKRSDVSLEQLYLTTDRPGEYQPHVMAEAVITFDEPRSGLHCQIVRASMAPLDQHAQVVRWEQAVAVNVDELTLSPVPDPQRATSKVPSEILETSSADGEEALREQLIARERFIVLQNPSFNLFSEQGETREMFIERCLQEANRQLSTQSERLESTARRRLDQMKQAVDREQRAIDDQDIHKPDEFRNDVNISWGRTLHNITSGKKATQGPSNSVREDDYKGKISQLQRTWDREREVLKEELRTKARSIEEIELAPLSRNIEITKYLIVWAPKLG
ncbi:MAG TPA: hypothetical protein VNM92_06520 [Thermoanaerobaculia bacterium]|nr:hypothetical protein [Thermoanaerobaculia bacterium]